MLTKHQLSVFSGVNKCAEARHAKNVTNFPAKKKDGSAARTAARLFDIRSEAKSAILGMDWEK